jgi:hypothetical protein
MSITSTLTVDMAMHDSTDLVVAETEQPVLTDEPEGIVCKPITATCDTEEQVTQALHEFQTANGIETSTATLRNLLPLMIA